MSGPVKELYLGDSVYCRISDEVVELWLDNGFGPKHAICLEPVVYRSLVESVEHFSRERIADDVGDPWQA